MIDKDVLKSMDNIIKLKKFFKLLYRGFDNANDEYIRVFQKDKANNMREKYFNNIDDLINYAYNSKNKYYKDTYFELNTTNGQGGTVDNLKTAYCIGFDFDLKDKEEGFNNIDILNVFKQNKIHYSCLVDSGHGFHIYICIQPTQDIELVNKVQTILAKKLGADINACKPTQLLRVPYSYNHKDEKAKMVKIVCMDDRDEINPYNINFLYKKNCTIKQLDNINSDNKNIKYLYKTTNIPPCIQKILNSGSPEEEHNRESDLCKIVVNLRQANKSFNEILSICKEWDSKSNFHDSLEYRVKWIYNNLKYNTGMQCKECEHRKECFNYTESEFDFDNLKDEEGNPYNVYTLEDKISKRVRNKRNGDNSMLNPNEVLILNVLRYEYDFPRPLTKNGMSIKLLKQSLTYKKKCCMSDKTIRNTLNTLIEKDFILENTGSRNTKYYKFNPIKTGIQNTIKISYLATAMCICGNISKSELSLYILMRYLHNQKIKLGEVKGNCFYCSQSDLAKRFYGDSTSENQAHISEMIHNLIESHMLDIWEITTSKNNGWEYLRYRLNC